MKRKLLKRGFSTYILDILMILFSLETAHHNYPENSLIFYISLIFCILFLISLCFHFYYPYLLELKNGILCFFPNLVSVTGKVCLQSNKIISIKRRKLNYGSFGRIELLPTYIFIMRDGTEHIFKPGRAPGKELDVIDSFLESIIDSPIIDVSSDRSMI